MHLFFPLLTFGFCYSNYKQITSKSALTSCNEGYNSKVFSFFVHRWWSTTIIKTSPNFCSCLKTNHSKYSCRTVTFNVFIYLLHLLVHFPFKTVFRSLNVLKICPNMYTRYLLDSKLNLLNILINCNLIPMFSQLKKGQWKH